MSKDIQNFRSLKGLQILAVDDEEDVLFLLQVLLESQGATVTTANSAQAALRELSLRRTDLIISDIAMPREDGLMLIQQIRSQHQGETVPAIAFSALDPEVCMAKCFKAGFQAYLAKPFDPQEMLAKILAVLPPLKPPAEQFPSLTRLG